jgi:hypothetical protein
MLHNLLSKNQQLQHCTDAQQTQRRVPKLIVVAAQYDAFNKPTLGQDRLLHNAT